MFLAIMLLLIITFIIWPIARQKYKERKDRKKEAEEKGLSSIPPKKKVSDRNGNQQDVSEFVSKLVTFARRNKIRTIIPGTVTFNGDVARISAIIAGHGRALGIFCLGYGGSVEPDLNKAEWRQELKGEVRYFKNPLKIADEMDDLVKAALNSKGVDIPFKTVCVFTTPDVDVTPLIQDVYTEKGFLYYLETAEWVKEGDLDMNAVADTILSFIPMDKIKEAQKERDRQIKEQQEQEKEAAKEARKEARRAKRTRK